MKIAVLIVGEYRQFPVAQQTWEFLKWEEVDIYFVTWNKTKHIDIDKKVKQKLLPVSDEDILNYVSPKKYKILDYHSNIFNTSKLFSNGAMMYLWQEAIKLLEEQEELYDYVILIRPDIALDYYDDELYDFFKNMTPCDRTIYLISCRQPGVAQIMGQEPALSDLALVGTQNAVTKIKNISMQSFYEMEPSKKLIDIHSFLADEYVKFYDRAYNLPIDDKCIVRTTSHLKFNQPFSVYKEDSKIWWETYWEAPYSTIKNMVRDKPAGYHKKTW